MNEDKFLYLVTCACRSSLNSEDTKDVYVIATDPSQAASMALAHMKHQGMKYDEYASNVKLLAAQGQRAPHTLVYSYPGEE